MFRLSIASLSAALAIAIGGASDARAAILDFTALSVSNNRGPSFNLNLSSLLPGLSVLISSAGGNITSTTFDGGASSACATLACVNDGLGVSDDEVTAAEVVSSGESLTFAFSDLVIFSGFSFLDLFKQPDSTNREKARITIDGTAFGPFGGIPDFQQNGGYGNFLIAPFTGKTVVFTMLGGATDNDGVGKPDAAIAAMTIAAIPLPAAGPLLLAGLAGLSTIARRRRRA